MSVAGYICYVLRAGCGAQYLSQLDL